MVARLDEKNKTKQQTKIGGKKRKKIRREKRWKKYKQSHNKRQKK